jgi:hypothetical protein
MTTAARPTTEIPAAQLLHHVQGHDPQLDGRARQDARNGSSEGARPIMPGRYATIATSPHSAPADGMSHKEKPSEFPQRAPPNCRRRLD